MLIEHTEFAVVVLKGNIQHLGNNMIQELTLPYICDQGEGTETSVSTFTGHTKEVMAVNTDSVRVVIFGSIKIQLSVGHCQELLGKNAGAFNHKHKHLSTIRP